MPHAYRVLAADLLTGQVREEIPFQTLQFGKQLNAPGTFAGRLGLRHPKATRANLDPGRTLIHVERDSVLIWSGILWAVKATVPVGGANPMLEADAQGWWSYFRKRTLRVDKIYSNVDQLSVVEGLLNWAQGVNGGNIGMVIPSTTSGYNMSATYYGVDRVNIGQTIETLATATTVNPSTPAGFDFDVSSAWSGAPATVVPTLNLYYPRKGRRLNIVAAIGSTLTGYEMDLDATMMANSVDAYGAGSGPSRLVSTQTNPNLLTTYPLLDGQTSNTQITDATTLAAMATSDLALMQTPIITWVNATTKSNTPDMALGSFDTGDLILFSGTDGYITASNTYYRVMRWDVSVDENGLETIGVTVVPEGTT